MRLIIIGCEYTGKTTFARNLQDWFNEHSGPGDLYMLHDHFLPFIGEGAPGRYSAEEECAEFFKLKSFALEKYMRYMTFYHFGEHFYSDNHHLVVNWYYGDAAYADLYFEYGGVGQYADRRHEARVYDDLVVKLDSQTVLLHLTARPEVIRERYRADPRPNTRFKEDDIEYILGRFQEEFGQTHLRRTIQLDTSESTPEETLNTFVERMQVHWTDSDRLRFLTRRLEA